MIKVFVHPEKFLRAWKIARVFFFTSNHEGLTKYRTVNNIKEKKRVVTFLIFLKFKNQPILKF
jgi:hypothetical protein